MTFEQGVADAKSRGLRIWQLFDRGDAWCCNIKADREEDGVSVTYWGYALGPTPSDALAGALRCRLVHQSSSSRVIDASKLRGADRDASDWI